MRKLFKAPKSKKALESYGSEYACPYCQTTRINTVDVTPLVQGEFDTERCGIPGCPCSHVHPLCPDHPDNGVLVEYCKRHATLTIVCNECHCLLNTIYVAKELVMVPSKDGPYLLEPEGNWQGNNANPALEVQ